MHKIMFALSRVFYLVHESTYECYTLRMFGIRMCTLMRCFSYPLSLPPLRHQNSMEFLGHISLAMAASFVTNHFKVEGKDENPMASWISLLFENCFSMWHLKYSKPHKSNNNHRECLAILHGQYAVGGFNLRLVKDTHFHMQMKSHVGRCISTGGPQGMELKHTMYLWSFEIKDQLVWKQRQILLFKTNGTTRFQFGEGIRISTY